MRRVVTILSAGAAIAVVLWFLRRAHRAGGRPAGPPDRDGIVPASERTDQQP
jgi:hypothetical protein